MPDCVTDDGNDAFSGVLNLKASSQMILLLMHEGQQENILVPAKLQGDVLRHSQNKMHSELDRFRNGSKLIMINY